MSDNEIPDEYLCPISLDLMSDPVICEDGHTYDRLSIMAVKNNLSPITRQLINKNNLIPNRLLKQMIDEFKENNNENKIKSNVNNIIPKSKKKISVNKIKNRITELIDDKIMSNQIDESSIYHLKDKLVAMKMIRISNLNKISSNDLFVKLKINKYEEENINQQAKIILERVRKMREKEFYNDPDIYYNHVSSKLENQIINADLYEKFIENQENTINLKKNSICYKN